MFGRLFGSNNPQERVSTGVTVIEARRLQQQGAQLIDVRETAEFASGHVLSFLKGDHIFRLPIVACHIMSERLFLAATSCCSRPWMVYRIVSIWIFVI
jgi:hypothetical protein